MQKKNKTENIKTKAAKTAIYIMIFSLASKFLGFARESLMAYKFGSGMETDAFVIAMTATSIITGLISDAVSTTFIPVLSEIEAKEGKKGKLDHTNNMLNIIGLFGIVLVIVAYTIAPVLVRLLAKDFQGDQYQLTLTLTKIGTPMIFFSGLIGTVTAFLHSEQRHIFTAASGLPFNLVYIIFLIFLAGTFKIKGLMVAAVLAVVAKLLIQLPDAKRGGFKYKFKFDLKDKYIKKVVYLSIPVFIGVAINDLNAIVDKTLASSLVEGSISALNYAHRLNSLILHVFIAAITTVIFPILSKESSQGNKEGMKSIINYGIQLILLITVPATIGLVVLSKPIVQVAFQRGKFDLRATMMTSQALSYYSLSLVLMAFRPLLTRIYYSLQDSKSPMINSVITVATNIVFNLILIGPMGHAGLALATSISMTASTIWMYYKLTQKIGGMGTMTHIKEGSKMLISSLIMGAAAYLVYTGLYPRLGTGFPANALALATAALTGATIYTLLIYTMKVKIARELIEKFVNKLRTMV